MRTKQLNVSPDVNEALWMLARTHKGESISPILTADEIADGLLRQYINDNYPDLFEQLSSHQKQVDTLRNKLIEQLTKPCEQQS